MYQVKLPERKIYPHHVPVLLFFSVEAKDNAVLIEEKIWQEVHVNGYADLFVSMVGNLYSIRFTELFAIGKAVVTTDGDGLDGINSVRFRVRKVFYGIGVNFGKSS